jgi:hypothetical protein
MHTQNPNLHAKQDSDRRDPNAAPQRKQPFVEPKLTFVEPKLVKQGHFNDLTGFFGPFTPPAS